MFLQILGRRERNKESSNYVCPSHYQQEWWGTLKCDTNWELKRHLLEEIKGRWHLKSHEAELGGWPSGEECLQLNKRTWDCISAPLSEAGHGCTRAQDPNTFVRSRSWLHTCPDSKHYVGEDRKITGGLLATSIALGPVRDPDSKD